MPSKDPQRWWPNLSPGRLPSLQSRMGACPVFQTTMYHENSGGPWFTPKGRACPWELGSPSSTLISSSLFGQGCPKRRSLGVPESHELVSGEGTVVSLEAALNSGSGQIPQELWPILYAHNLPSLNLTVSADLSIIYCQVSVSIRQA